MLNLCVFFNASSLVHAIGGGDLEFDSWIGQISTVPPTAHHCCNVSSMLCCPSAKLRRWGSLLVTFLDICHDYNEDLIFLNFYVSSVCTSVWLCYYYQFLDVFFCRR